MNESVMEASAHRRALAERRGSPRNERALERRRKALVWFIIAVLVISAFLALSSALVSR